MINTATRESLSPTETLRATSHPENTPTGLPLEPVGVTQPAATPTQEPVSNLTQTPAACFSLLAPTDESELSGTGKVKFEWLAMPGAVRYEILYLLPSGRMEIYTTNEPAYTRGLESLPLPGLYRWQVTAFNPSGERMCIVGMYRFTRPVPAPTARPPKDDEPNDPGGPGDSGDPFGGWGDFLFDW